MVVLIYPHVHNDTMAIQFPSRIFMYLSVGFFVLVQAFFVFSGFLTDFMPDWVFVEHDDINFWLNLVVGLAYYAVAISIIVIVQKRKSILNMYLFLLYLFILFCGTIHFVHSWLYYKPIYGVETVLTSVTAFISLLTVGLMWKLIPIISNVPSDEELQKVNTELRNQNAINAELVDQLRETQQDLEIAVAERDMEIVKKEEVLRNLRQSKETIMENERQLAQLLISRGGEPGNMGDSSE